MGLIADNKAFKAAYSMLTDDQIERFFPGQEAQARKAIESLVWLLGDRLSYDRALELYLTVAVRVTMSFEKERIHSTLKLRFSDIMPDNKALTVIDCIGRIKKNFDYIHNANTPKQRALDSLFDSQNESSFTKNEKRSEDALRRPGFGTDPHNPIYAHSADGSYGYLNLLYTTGHLPLTWRRVGSFVIDADDEPIDEYELLLPDGNLYSTIYVNMYSRANTRYCPYGLIGNGLEPLPETAVDVGKQNTAEKDESSEDEEYLMFLQRYSSDLAQSDNKGKAGEKVNTGSRTGAGRTSKESALFSQEDIINERFSNTLQGDIPVIYVKGVLFKKHQNIFAVCTYMPITERPIRAMQVDIQCYDIWNEPVDLVEGFEYHEQKTQRGSVFGNDTLIPISNPNTRSVEVIIRRILFSDGTVVFRTRDCVKLPDITTLQDELGSKDLFEEYCSQTYGNAKYMPVKAGNVWRCTCGELNRQEETQCWKCGNSPDLLFDKLDKTALQASLEEKARIKREREEQQRIEREKERQRRKEEEKEKQRQREAEAKALAEKIRANNKKIIIGSAGAAAIALLIYLIGWQLIPGFQYRKADKLLSSGDREAAYAAFSDLGRFRDSRDRAMTIRYEDAEAALDAGELEKAYSIFISIADYSDSRVRAYESAYAGALLYMDGGSYSKAAELFELIQDYKDSKALMRQCKNEDEYINATAHLEKKEYEKAGKAFETLNDYRDSAELMRKSYYLFSVELIGKGSLHEAYLILSGKVNKGANSYEDSIELANNAEYQYASDCFSQEDYSRAADSFANIKKYKDSAERSADAKYRYGLQLMDKKKYNKAIEVFEQLKGHKKAAEKLKEAQYQYALQLVDLGKYDDAEKLFKGLGKYQDSEKQLKKTRYKHALNLVEKKEYSQAIAIFKALGKYSDSEKQMHEAMYAYVKAHYNNTDKTTYDYLKQLKTIKYGDSAKLYSDLYSWKATPAFYLSTSNTSPVTSIAKHQNYVRVELRITGGTPGESVDLHINQTWPGHKRNHDKKGIKNGTVINLTWNGFNADKSGELIVKVSIKGKDKPFATVKLPIK